MKRISPHANDAEFAVFAMNHREHLEEAVRAARNDPSVRRTFRSRRRWVAAARIVGRYGPVPVYFAVVDSDFTIQYEATLVDVCVNPDRAAARTRKLLGYSGKTTKRDGLWNDTVKTLYVVTGCRKLRSRFPQTELLKFEGGAPLAGNYKRPYARVRRRGGAA